MSTNFRNAKIAKIKIAQKELAMADEAYRALLLRVTKKNSCSKMNLKELDLVLDEMVKKGFVSKPSKGKSTPIRTKQYDLADMRDKVLSLWLALAEIGIVQDSSDAALAVYCKKISKVDHWRFADFDDCEKIIEGLKVWNARELYKLLYKKLGISDDAALNIAQTSIKRASKSRYNKSIPTLSYAAASGAIQKLCIRNQIDDVAAFVKGVSQ